MPKVTCTLPVASIFFLNRHSETNSEKLVFIAGDADLRVYTVNIRIYCTFQLAAGVLQ